MVCQRKRNRLRRILLNKLTWIDKVDNKDFLTACFVQCMINCQFQNRKRRNKQIVKETIGVGVNEKAVLRFDKTALSFTSISIFPW